MAIGKEGEYVREEHGSTITDEGLDSSNPPIIPKTRVDSDGGNEGAIEGDTRGGGAIDAPIRSEGDLPTVFEEAAIVFRVVVVD